MLALIPIILDIIAPIFVFIGLAFFIGRRFQPDPRALSVFVVYVFIPALVYRGMAYTELQTDELLQLVLVAGGVMLATTLLSVALVRSGLVGGDRADRRREGALVLASTLMNAANYGIPVCTFAFGAVGGQAAIVYYVGSSLVGNVVGVYYASRGTVSARRALGNVLTVPIVYAAILGLLVNFGQFPLPATISRALDLMADAAIPGMLALLGLSLARTHLRDIGRAIMAAVGVRLLVAPLIAFGLASLLSLQGVTFSVAIVQSAMPTAVLASALASEFGGDAPFVSAATLISTFTSFLSLAFILFLLGAPA